MARGYRSPPPAGPKAGQEPVPLGNVRNGARVMVRKQAGGTRLFTHRDGNALAGERVKGAIVRVEPKSDATQEERDALKRFLIEMGAVHVWFTSAAARAKVVTRRAQQETRPVETVNQAVDAMLAVVRTQDRELLTRLVQHFLGKAGA